MKKIIIPILVLLLLTGYTPYVEVNDLVIVDMLGLEKVDNDYILTINTVYEEKDNNATKSIYKDYVFKGKSLGKVFLEAKKINTKKAYYGHLKLVVFQSKLLDKELINYFQKEFKEMNYLIIGTDSRINDLFKKYNSSSKIIKAVNKEKISNADIHLATFEDYLKDIVNKKRTSTLPVVSLNNNNLVVKGLETYQKNILLSKEQAKITYLLNNKITSFHQSIKLNDKYYEVEFNNVKTLYQQGKVNLLMNIKCSDTSNKKIKELKKVVEELFRKEIDELLTFQNDNNIKLVLPSNDINIIIGADWS
ncbi:MAG: hypothetical protein PUB03_05080 [bacterium]|nr:hypothetical protein [bacterium]